MKFKSYSNTQRSGRKLLFILAGPLEKSTIYPPQKNTPTHTPQFFNKAILQRLTTVHTWIKLSRHTSGVRSTFRILNERKQGNGRTQLLLVTLFRGIMQLNKEKNHHGQDKTSIFTGITPSAGPPCRCSLWLLLCKYPPKEETHRNWPLTKLYQVRCHQVHHRCKAVCDLTVFFQVWIQVQRPTPQLKPDADSLDLAALEWTTPRGRCRNTQVSRSNQYD